MTQCNMILKYIKMFGSITQAEAVTELGCYRLAARIADLERDGYRFKHERIGSTNRFGEKVYFTKYSFMADEEVSA